jgi:hypothetical protein
MKSVCQENKKLRFCNAQSLSAQLPSQGGAKTDEAAGEQNNTGGLRDGLPTCGSRNVE